MVTAGFPATVAPLGTALTEDQLGLLWRMADEPILCFDGDIEGQRAAFRAVDLVLPRLKPGKSVRFALLPEGQDPDDLVRAGGRAAMAEVLSGARALADMLWARETEAVSLDTPERRAALEARLHEVVRGIGDDQVRKYYAHDFAARLRSLLMPGADIDRPERGRWMAANTRSANWREPARGRGGSSPRHRHSERGPPPAPSPRLSGSPLVRGFRSVIPPREALILVAVVNHCWLLEERAEEFASIEFLNPDADRLRRAILEAALGQGESEPDALRAALQARGLGAVLARVEAAMSHPSDWPARPGASADDVAQFWTHVVSLHRKQRTLNRELKDAERALGEEPTDANLAWLRDVQGRLSALDGAEALIEGFGLSSGRPVRGL
jgi:DNA primase